MDQASAPEAEPLPEVLYIIGPLQIGGTERHVLSVAPGLQRLGWRTSVYSLAGHGPLYEEFFAAGIDVIMPPVKRIAPMSLATRIVRLATTAANLFRTLKARRPAIVHYMLPVAYQTGAPIAVLARSPVQVMSRRCLNDYQSERSFVRPLEHWLHGRMTAILGNSQRIVSQLRDEGIAAPRLGLIYNGVDASQFSTAGNRLAIRARLGLAPSTLALMSVANLIPAKGHGDLVAALKLARPHMTSDWHLLLAGQDYDLEQRLRVQAEEAGILRQISFLGARKDIPDLLGASDIAVLASHEEGFSNAILEKMATGLPVIATDVGGNREAVVHGETGLIVPARDPACLAQAIAQLAGDAALRAAMGVAARSRVEAHFSLERCVDAYDRLYRTLLGGGSLADAGVATQ